MNLSYVYVAAMFLSVACVSSARADEAAAKPENTTQPVPDPISFSSQIAPILLDSCVACHSAKKAEGGYRVDSFTELMKPGDSGETPVAIVAKDQPADAEKPTSELLRRLSCDESERMPAESEPLPPEQVNLIAQWIDQGARFDGDAPQTPLWLVIPPPTYADPPESYARTIPVTSAIFSPDGTQVIVGGYHELTIWDPQTGTLVRRIKNIGQRVFAMAFASDGQTLAVACGEPGRSGEVRLIDFGTGELKGVIARTGAVALDLAFRPGTDTLAIASADASIHVYDCKTLAKLHSIASHADWVTAVSWSDDGARLASASRDKSAKVYDGESFELLASYLGHGAPVRGVSILPGGTQVVSVGGDSKLHRWEVEAAKKTAEVALGSEGFKIVRGTDFLLVPLADHRVIRINLADNKLATEFSGHTDWALTTTLREQQVMSGAFNGEIRIWHLADASLLHNWSPIPR
ncbi:MAG: c-type cytochrome domain-containing protein [Pirellulaceae bacterium]